MAPFELTDPELLRGMPLSRNLRCLGSVLKNSSSSSSTYALSEPVGGLDFFLSHNWSTPRWAKFLALVCHFNLRRALLGMLLGSALGTWLTATGAWPSLEMPVPWLPRGTASLIFGTLALWSCMLGVHELDCLLCRLRPGPCVFLDKTCINQSSEELKRAGIEALGAFLAESRHFVILYSNTYFKKIWTVYELACFLCVKTADNCVFLSVYSPPVLVGGSFAILAYFMLTTLGRAGSAEDSSADFVTILLAGLAISFVAVAISSEGVVHVTELRTALQKFRIDECSCFDEKDRPLVYRNIEKFMKTSGWVQSSCPQREAMDVFETLVQSRMILIVDRFFGRLMLPYQHAAFIALPQLMVGFDTVGAKLNRGDPLPSVALAGLYCALEAFTSWPLGMASGLLLMRLAVHRGLRSRRARVSFAFLAAFVPLVIIWILAEEETRSRGFFVVAYVAFVAVMLTLVWAAYGRIPLLNMKRQDTRIRSSWHRSASTLSGLDTSEFPSTQIFQTSNRPAPVGHCAAEGDSSECNCWENNLPDEAIKRDNI